MGRRKKSCQRKGNAATANSEDTQTSDETKMSEAAKTTDAMKTDGAAKTSDATKMNEVTKTSEATKSGTTVAKEEQNNNDAVLEQKLASCQLVAEIRPWEALKSAGNNLFVENKYQEALEEYILAIEALKIDETVQSCNEELAKLYGNRSITYHKMSQVHSGTDEFDSLCERALDDGKKAIELDEKYEKGYFRCISALLSIGKKSDAIGYATRVLDLYAQNKKSYRDDLCLKTLLAECQYMSAMKTKSPNWDRVKFKDSCIVLDADGMGDVTALTSKMIHDRKKLSVLVKPGRYCFECLHVVKGDELDIVGDFDANGSPKDIVFYCQGSSAIDPKIVNIFMVEGGSLYLENVSVRQESNHPEKHGIFAAAHGIVTVTNCNGYTRSSGWIAVAQFSQLTLSKSTIDGACGGVIVVSGASAIIEDCSIKNCERIGVEARAGGVILLKGTEISLCGSQGLASHADAGACIVESCVFYGNSRKLQDQASVTVARSIAYMRNTQVTTIRGSCVMVQEGGKLELEQCRLAGGQVSIGFSINGSARISRCKIANCNYGLMLIMNRPGQVVMRDNEIKARVAEIGLSRNDDPPVMLGAKKHVVKNHDGPSNIRRRLERSKEKLEHDQFQEGMQWEDPRKAKVLETRVCFPCGLGQSSVGRNYLQCEGCHLYWYCSKECQTRGSALHQPMCKNIQEIWKSDEPTPTPASTDSQKKN